MCHACGGPNPFTTVPICPKCLAATFEAWCQANDTTETEAKR